MYFEIFVEELSAEETLKNLIPKIIGDPHQFNIHAYSGKSDFKKKILSRLKGYKNYITDNHKIFLLLDNDENSCYDIKTELEDYCQKARLISKSKAKDPKKFHVITRVVVKELESWFFGDMPAIKTAYPKIPKNKLKKYRDLNPDKLSGGTWEKLHEVLKSGGYYPRRYSKIEVSQKISPYMNVNNNKSISFNQFKQALEYCILV
jgi:hypothetical protein